MQSDNNVKKISSHITKKVADKLAELYKNDKADFEKKWDDIRLFIQYGMLTDEKFYERAVSFALFKNIDGSYFNLEEYKEKIKDKQTDKDGNLVVLYTQDPDANYTHIERARQKEYDVLLMDGELDVHAMSQLEQKNEKLRFTRIDSDILENLIRKEDAKKDEYTEEQKEGLRKAFEAVLPQDKKLNYYIRALYPISSPQEISVAEELLPQTDLAAKQTYFYRFWITRNAMEPENEWNKYYEKLKYVDENFSYPKTPGFLTDRGRIYLQYGPPDYVRDEKNFVGVKGFVAQPKVSSNTDRTSERYNQRDDNGQGHVHYLPYIIWRYNRMENDFPNRVFLFWDEHRSGYYKLLNSNARGELRTPGWERMLCRNQLEEEVLGDVGHQFERGM